MGKINVNDKILVEKPKKTIKDVDLRNFYMKFQLKGRLGM